MLRALIAIGLLPTRSVLKMLAATKSLASPIQIQEAIRLLPLIQEQRMQELPAPMHVSQQQQQHISIAFLLPSFVHLRFDY